MEPHSVSASQVDFVPRCNSGALPITEEKCAETKAALAFICFLTDVLEYCQGLEQFLSHNNINCLQQYSKGVDLN